MYRRRLRMPKGSHKVIPGEHSLGHTHASRREPCIKRDGGQQTELTRIIVSLQPRSRFTILVSKTSVYLQLPQTTTNDLPAGRDRGIWYLLPRPTPYHGRPTPYHGILRSVVPLSQRIIRYRRRSLSAGASQPGNMPR